MQRSFLIEQIQQKRSFLCVGLDTDLSQIPPYLLETEDPLFEFNRQIIDATHDFCVAYKPNTAFYERYGETGWRSLQKTIDYIPKNCLVIADAKRGDIGNTAKEYAYAFYETLQCDAITVNPYMGEDSIRPFVDYLDSTNQNKWLIVLALTSNKGAFDFQLSTDATGEELYKKVIKHTLRYTKEDNCMFVVGATQADKLLEIRQLIPDHFLLIPGVGQQGGSIEEVIKYGQNKDFGLLINASRSIIYASKTKDFALKAREQAQFIQKKMDSLAF